MYCKHLLACKISASCFIKNKQLKQGVCFPILFMLSLNVIEWRHRPGNIYTMSSVKTVHCIDFISGERQVFKIVFKKTTNIIIHGDTKGLKRKGGEM